MTSSASQILIVGSNGAGSIERAYRRGLATATGHEPELFDIGAFTRASAGHQLSHRVLSRIRAPFASRAAGNSLLALLEARPTAFTTIIVVKGAEVRPEVLSDIKARWPAITLVNINPDDPLSRLARGSSNRNIVGALPLYDLYCVWSRHLVQKIRDFAGIRVEYLPFGYDPSMHVRGRIRGTPSGIVFVGTRDAQREEALEQLADLDLRVYGSFWDRVPARSPLRARIQGAPLYGQELADTVANAAGALNILRPQNAGAHNMRTFEIPAAGGLLVTTRSAEQQELFPEGVASMMFGSIAELRDVLKALLSNPGAHQHIRDEGARRVVEHTYERRARQLLAMIAEGVRPHA